MTIKHQCRCVAETMALGARLGRCLGGGEVICLEGTLGAGKTCFVRGLAVGLGLDPSTVSSPSFIICREHGNHAPAKLAHVDAYRLSGAGDLEAVGWEELVSCPDTIVAVEWSQRIQAALPEARVEVLLEHTGPTSRLITIKAPAALARRLEHLDEEESLV